MPAEARLVHRLPGRLRLRFAGHKWDEAYMRTLADALRGAPGVREVAANPLTGSLLIHHQGDERAILQYAAERGLFEVHAGQSGPVEVQAQMEAALRELSRGVEAVTGGTLNLDALIIAALAALAIQQAIEGNVMVPAASLLWYAYNASRMPPLGRGPGPAPAPPGGPLAPSAGGPGASRSAQRRHKVAAHRSPQGGAGRAAQVSKP